MKKIKWKKAKGGRAMEHLLEGFVDGKKAFVIEGRLCVTDLREMFSYAEWRHPKHYSIVDRGHGKLIAHELLNGINVEKHQANWQAGEDENARTAKLIEEAEEFIAKLKNQ